MNSTVNAPVFPESGSAALDPSVVPSVTDDLKALRDKLASGQRLSRDDGMALYAAEDLHAVGRLARWVALGLHGRRVSYVRNAHVNYSNYCALSCAFCSFYRKKGRDRRPGGYEMSLEQVLGEADRIAEDGCTEVHVVGGLHPDFPFSYYTGMLEGIRARHPRLGLKCFTAIEIYHLAGLARLSPSETLVALKEAGLQSLPGGGAEILDDGIRDRICRGKERSEEWLELHRTAHRLGIPSNATMLHGHFENAAHCVDHMLKIRALQDETSGFLAFIPLSYHPGNNPLRVRHGPGAAAELRTCAIARLLLDNVPHIKAYWITLGVPVAQMAILYGATDVDGTVKQEKVYHMAGAQTPQELGVDQLHQLIREADGEPLERDHLYREIVRRSDDPRDWHPIERASGSGPGV
jgi:aminodeoxyfutalosine synthase